MPTEFDKCEQQAKHLPLQDRARLIKHLIAGLDDLEEQDLERLWLNEAKRRFQGFKSGKIQTRLSEDVFRDAQQVLQDVR